MEISNEGILQALRDDEEALQYEIDSTIDRLGELTDEISKVKDAIKAIELCTDCNI